MKKKGIGLSCLFSVILFIGFISAACVDNDKDGYTVSDPSTCPASPCYGTGDSSDGNNIWIPIADKNLLEFYPDKDGDGYPDSTPVSFNSIHGKFFAKSLATLSCPIAGILFWKAGDWYTGNTNNLLVRGQNVTSFDCDDNDPNVGYAKETNYHGLVGGGVCDGDNDGYIVYSAFGEKYQNTPNSKIDCKDDDNLIANVLHGTLADCDPSQMDNDGDLHVGIKYYLAPTSSEAIKEGDCKDDNSDIHPNAHEICGNGIDEDCDGGDLSCDSDTSDPSNKETCVDNDFDGYYSGKCDDGAGPWLGVPMVEDARFDLTLDKETEKCGNVQGVLLSAYSTSEEVKLACTNDADNDGVGDYADCSRCINPGMPEVCDGINNNGNLDRNGKSLVDDNLCGVDEQCVKGITTETNAGNGQKIVYSFMPAGIDNKDANCSATLFASTEEKMLTSFFSTTENIIIDSFRGECDWNRFYQAVKNAGNGGASLLELNKNTAQWKTACVKKDKCADGYDNTGKQNLIDAYNIPFMIGKINMRLKDQEDVSCKKYIPGGVSNSNPNFIQYSNAPYCKDQDRDGYCTNSDLFPDCDDNPVDDASQYAYSNFKEETFDLGLGSNLCETFAESTCNSECDKINYLSGMHPVCSVSDYSCKFNKVSCLFKMTSGFHLVFGELTDSQKVGAYIEQRKVGLSPEEGLSLSPIVSVTDPQAEVSLQGLELLSYNTVSTSFFDTGSEEDCSTFCKKECDYYTKGFIANENVQKNQKCTSFNSNLVVKDHSLYSDILEIVGFDRSDVCECSLKIEDSRQTYNLGKIKVKASEVHPFSRLVVPGDPYGVCALGFDLNCNKNGEAGWNFAGLLSDSPIRDTPFDNLGTRPSSSPDTGKELTSNYKDSVDLACYAISVDDASLEEYFKVVLSPQGIGTIIMAVSMGPAAKGFQTGLTWAFAKVIAQKYAERTASEIVQVALIGLGVKMAGSRIDECESAFKSGDRWAIGGCLSNVVGDVAFIASGFVAGIKASPRDVINARINPGERNVRVISESPRKSLTDAERLKIQEKITATNQKIETYSNLRDQYKSWNEDMVKERDALPIDSPDRAGYTYTINLRKQMISALEQQTEIEKLNLAVLNSIQDGTARATLAPTSVAETPIPAQKVTEALAEQGQTGGGCFLADTQITMADGTKKNIQDISVGDNVLAYDLENKKTVEADVTKTFIREATKYRIIEYA